ncbi:cobalt-precorrin-5B (C(1))-methyltransferase [Chitinophaga sp. G-6-1-13]|uniref:Cobalt-precorrin-5B C(1)-methyltransferase n=1 Tax=Chitinophaga fulva TaxID=2728842 RepID=A0A848GST8_9BACT|nr:cobalt-precorrin-5B (C(1))-methyltransferase [Chitinophaga fulva]NML40409.1 cobalt-precorrin-5B (C(1))-methyltransferase [Chitinophaga fulva]
MSLKPIPSGDLRWGYSTGACATACTQAALQALIEQEEVAVVTITLPGGEEVLFKIHACSFDTYSATCVTYKDSGDDPDVTNGAEIASTVYFGGEQAVTFLPGKGVGMVTLPGLPVAVGEPAINPVPRQMMRQVVEQLLLQHQLDKRVCISVSVPMGEELARKTLNSRLGIVDGISILGTTGKVKPFSSAAYIASIEQGIDVAIANGLNTVVINSGGRSEKILKALFPALPMMGFVQYGNWIGETLAKINNVPLTSFTIGMMLGKAVKIAGGALNTHSNQSSWNKEFVASLATKAGYPKELCDSILSLNMARGLTELFPFREGEPFYTALAAQCREVITKEIRPLPFKIVLIDATDKHLLFGD